MEAELLKKTPCQASGYAWPVSKRRVRMLVLRDASTEINTQPIVLRYSRTHNTSKEGISGAAFSDYDYGLAPKCHAAEQNVSHRGQR